MTLLDIDSLRVVAESPSGVQSVLVDGVSLSISRGERVALVGESGSGKSVTARSILRLDDKLVLEGSICVDGEEVTAMPQSGLRSIRGARVGMVFQDPMSSLNPLMKIGEQIMEPMRIRGLSRAEARERAIEILDELGVVDAANRMKAFPHEFSGGMRQRVVIAIALAGNPDLLLADEPTTALDVRVQAQVLGMLSRVAERRGLAVLLITHDVGIVAGFADRVVVMYSGRIVEDAEVHEFFRNPKHPYTKGLLAAVPRLDNEGRIPSMPGSPPSPARRPQGCAFSPRCPLAEASCRAQRPELLALHGRSGHRLACPVVIEAARRDNESLGVG